jgi:hypothetical protein
VPFDAVDESAAAKRPEPPPPPQPPQIPFPRIDAVAGDTAPPLKTRRRSRPDDAQQSFGIDLPELRVPSFGGTDEEAIMPDPPPPRATYEDNDGPPLPL